MIVATVFVALLWSLACFAQNQGNAPAARWWSHMQVLASDKLEGRLTGSAGHRKAVEYAAQQFKKAGLKPAGTDGYFQPVQFVRRQIDGRRGARPDPDSQPDKHGYPLGTIVDNPQQA